MKIYIDIEKREFTLEEIKNYIIWQEESFETELISKLISIIETSK